MRNRKYSKINYKSRTETTDLFDYLFRNTTFTLIELEKDNKKRLSKKIAPFAIVYFGKKYYLTVAKNKHYSNG